MNRSYSFATTGSTTYQVLIHAVPSRDPPMDPRLVEAIYEACAWLELEPPLPNHDAVKAQRKRLAKQYHPDRGGDADTMKQVERGSGLPTGVAMTDTVVSVKSIICPVHGDVTEEIKRQSRCGDPLYATVTLIRSAPFHGPNCKSQLLWELGEAS